MSSKLIQANFSYGELDPKLLCRPDFEGYYKGARRLRNVIVIPQGGVKRRFGTSFGFSIVDTGDGNQPVTNRAEIRTVVFDFSRDKHFLIVMRPNDRLGTAGVAFDIYLNDVFQVSKITTDYTIAQIADVHFTKAQDRIIILHKQVAPHELFRGASDILWTLKPIDFIYKPIYDFSVIDNTDNYRTAYFGIYNAWKPTAQSGQGITINVTLVPVLGVEFFNSSHVGGLITGNGGVARITAVASTISATADVIQDFANTNFVSAKDTILQGVAWGDFTASPIPSGNRGWPSVGEFFQGRLILAATPSLPNFLNASNVLDYYNFDTAEGTDLNAFTLSIGSNGNEEIQDVIGTKALVVLGFSSIYSSSLFVEQPMTAANAFINEQSRDGSSFLECQIVDNQIFYIDENEEQVRAARYDIATSSFNIFDASLLSPQLIKDPVSTAALRPRNDDGSYYIVVNDDGTMAIYQSLQDQSVNAWTLSETRGSIFEVTTSRDTAYMVSRRCVTTDAMPTGFADNIYTANVNFQAIANVTAAAEDPAIDVPIFTAVSDYLVIGHESPFYNVFITLNTPASVSIDPTFEYLDKFGEWVSFSPMDGTLGFIGDGNISWSLNADMKTWAPMDISENPNVHIPTDSINGIVTKFWIRIRRNAATVAVTPIENSIFINIINKTYLENIDFNQYMDSVLITQSDALGLVTGLTSLIGQQVYVLSNTIPEGPYFVSNSGTITIRNPSTVTDSVQVGLNYIPEIVPMPLVVTGQDGVRLFQPKFVKQIFVYYYNSIGILVNGEEVPTLKVGSLVLDQIPIPVTDFYETSPRKGWDPTGYNIISQKLPLPFTIIGIGYVLEALS